MINNTFLIIKFIYYQRSILKKLNNCSINVKFLKILSKKNFFLINKKFNKKKAIKKLKFIYISNIKLNNLEIK